MYHVYYNFVLPHASLRQPLPVSESTNGRGSAKRWRPCTPAMAAGLTDHVWTLKEVLLYRVGVALLEQRYCIGKTRGSGKLRFPRRVALGETGGEANH